MEMMQATSCSNTDVNPCSAKSNRAALANGRTALATRRITTSMLICRPDPVASEPPRSATQMVNKRAVTSCGVPTCLTSDASSNQWAMLAK